LKLTCASGIPSAPYFKAEGLDCVEIVLRAEEFFAIPIGDDAAGIVRKVGDFYKLICVKLDVSPVECPVTSARLRLGHRKGKDGPVSL
jgi:hypothetical protein